MSCMTSQIQCVFLVNLRAGDNIEGCTFKVTIVAVESVQVCGVERVTETEGTEKVPLPGQGQTSQLPGAPIWKVPSTTQALPSNRSLQFDP